MTLKILWDGYWWSNGPPSGRAVLRSLIETWATHFSEDELTVVVPRACPKESWSHASNVHFAPISRGGHILANTHYVRSLAADHDGVVVQNFAFKNHVPVVAFIHDVIWQEHPEWFTVTERLYLNFIPRLAVKANCQVLTSTHAEADRIERLNKGLRGWTTPVGLSVPLPFLEAHSASPDRSVPKDFLLSVGRLNVRKNLDSLICALANAGLIDVDRPLLIVGEPGGRKISLSPIAQAAVESHSVLFTGRISDQSLKWLYEQCSTFVFPSLDEGFGLPLLEAALSGCSIAASDIPAFREVGLGSVCFFDPTNVTDMANAVRISLQRPEARTPLTSKDALEAWSTTVANMRCVLADAPARRSS